MMLNKMLHLKFEVVSEPLAVANGLILAITKVELNHLLPETALTFQNKYKNVK